MKVFEQIAKVHRAELRMTAARHRLSPPAAALLARGRKYPLTTVGTAAGAGFVLGSLNVHPLRIPGLAPLLGGGLAEAVAYGTRLIAELGTLGLAAHELGAKKKTGTDSGGGEPS